MFYRHLFSQPEDNLYTVLAHLGLGCDPLCEVRHGIFHLWLPVRDQNMSNCGAAQSLKFCIKDVQSVPYPRRQFTSDRQRLLSPGPNVLLCVLQNGNVLLKIFRDHFFSQTLYYMHITILTTVAIPMRLHPRTRMGRISQYIEDDCF